MWFINSDWLIFCEVIIHYKQKFCRLVVISLALLVFYYGWVFHMPEFHVKYWYICVIVDETFTTCGSSIYSSVSRCWYLTMNNVYVRKNNWTGFCCQCILTCVCQLSFYLSSDVYMAMFEWTRYNYAFLYTMYVHSLKRCFIIINIFFCLNSFILSLWLTLINCVEPFQAKADSFNRERFTCNRQSFYFTDKY